MNQRPGESGFGLLEILALIGVIALVVVLSYPGYKRTGLMTKATQLRGELGEIEQAMAAASTALKAPPGSLLTFEQISPHLRSPSPSLKKGLDPFGNAYGPQRNDQKPSMPDQSANHLRGVVPEDFWGTAVNP